MTTSLESKMTTLNNFTRVALPLMLSSLSTILMVTVDRIMLASYDVMAMNAISSIGILIFAVERSIGCITSMSEVLSGQFNGAGKHGSVAGPAWQMLFFAIFSIIIFVPIGLLAGPYIIQPIFQDAGLEFFSILMSFLFLSPAFMAISGFFIATNQTGVIAITSVIANLCNIVFDYFFIFGIDGVMEPMGMTGAAIGTSIALFIQFAVIFVMFLSKKQNDKYNTRKCHFDLKVMLTCLKIGIPDAFGFAANMLGLYAVIIIVTEAGVSLVTVHNICQNLFIAIYFASEGIQKAVIGMGANILGEGKYEQISELLKSAVKLQFIAFGLMVIPMLIFPTVLAGLYTGDNSIISSAEMVIPWVWLYYIVDGVTWILGSMLIAGGDTTFVCLVVFVCVWLLRVLPLYLLERADMISYATSWQNGNIADLVMLCLFFVRLRRGQWRKVSVVK